MTADDQDARAGVDVAAQAEDLVAGLLSEPWGQVSPSVYETGRLVTLAPWLTGHRRRVAHLLETQRPDGGWGAPGGYALVPTLSATEAILASLRRPGDSGLDRADYALLIEASDSALRMLFRLLPDLDGASIPDTPAADLIANSLVDRINQHLDGLPAAPAAELARTPGEDRLRLPEQLGGARLSMIRAALDAGARPPEKLLHALEVVGDAVRGARTISRPTTGMIGASPAATAAWLDERASRDPANAERRVLETVANRHGGPVPCGIPITVFERAWVLTTLARARIPVAVPAQLVASLEPALNPAGTPAGDGLPADADTTSAALYVFGLLGIPYRPDSLWAFWTGTHFCTWQGEGGLSVSVNAHVLEAFGQYLVGYPKAVPRYAATLALIAALLRDHQHNDGSWMDRWHASPYYATACCALALDRFGGGASAAAIRAAVRWVLATQRTDGSWGLWGGTAEETAYAMQILLLTRAEENDAGASAAVARGRAYLLRSAGRWDGSRLWHDKDLYQPVAVVRAAILAALHLAAPAW